MARRAVSALGEGLRAQGISRHDPESIYRYSAGLFLRLLAVELGCRAGRLSGECSLHALPDPTGQRGVEVLRQVDRHLAADGEAGFRFTPQPLNTLPEGRQEAGWTVESLDHDLLRVATRAVMTLADESASPAETLSSSYEQLLVHRPCISQGRFALQRSVERRRRSGTFYTPPWVARMVVEAALGPLLDDGGKLPTVLDPAMGAGVFLIETYRFLRRRLAGADLAASYIAERCLHGLDCDRLSVEAATLAVWLETGAPPKALAHTLRTGDLLGGQPFAVRFDAVVGNPPWGAHYSPEERQQLRERFPRSVAGTFDSFKLFLDASATLSQGTVGMVVPQAVLAQAAHGDVRATLLDRLDPYSAVNLGDGIFAGAAAPACILVFGRKPGPSTVHCVDRRATTEGHPEGHLEGTRHAVPAFLWSAERFPLQSAGRLSLLHRLRKHPSLGQLAHLYRVRDVGINYSRASVARRVLYAGSAPEDARDLARFRGRDFARYSGTRPGGWLRHNARELLQPGETLSMDPSTYRLPEKIVFRQTADRIVATLDRSRMAMGRSVIAITRDADVSLRALLACLNSRLLTVLYRTLAGE